MVYRLKTIFVTFAAMLFMLAVPVSYVPAVAASSGMAGMSHDSGSAGSCLTACTSATGNRHEDDTVDREADDEPVATPFFVLLRSPLPIERKQHLPARFTQRPPPKVPLYIQFAQLRP